MKHLFWVLALTTVCEANEIVEFHIVKGTGRNSWNTPETMVKVVVGQTLRIHNDDTINHILHTNGAPCSHGVVIAPTSYWDCEVGVTYSETVNGPLYDHNFGKSSRFYLQAE